MKRNYEMELFQFIHKWGPMFGDSFCIIDNTGPNANGGFYYRVFLKGGVSFDISKEIENDETTYCCDLVWAGPFDASSARDVQAVLLMLGHNPC